MVIEKLWGLFPKGAPLHEPSIGGNAWTYVKECLDTGWVSTAGQYVNQFEKELQYYTGANHAIATVNGTSALHICLLLANVKRNHEVIVPAMTFVATANAVAYCGAIPHFADSDRDTLSLDIARLEKWLELSTDISDGKCKNRRTGRHISAVICVHTLGHMADIEKLSTVCKRFKLTLIEDAAEALGSFRHGIHAGSGARLAALSFNGNKILTTGGGGAILTCDGKTAEQARHLTTTGKTAHAWAFNHDAVAYNYRLPNLNAALGCAQLEQMPAFIAAKRRIAEGYAKLFSDVPGVKMIREPKGAKSNYWLNAILLDPAHAGVRNQILAATNNRKIHTRPAWTPMHHLPMYSDSPRMDLHITEELFSGLIDLPSGVELLGYIKK